MLLFSRHRVRLFSMYQFSLAFCLWHNIVQQQNKHEWSELTVRIRKVHFVTFPVNALQSPKQTQRKESCNMITVSTTELHKLRWFHYKSLLLTCTGMFRCDFTCDWVCRWVRKAELENDSRTMLRWRSSLWNGAEALQRFSAGVEKQTCMYKNIHPNMTSPAQAVFLFFVWIIFY